MAFDVKGGGLVNFFENYLANGSIFLDKNAIQSDYTPEKISHRDAQVEQTAKILAPVLRRERPSNLFIYGKTGTGKTLTARFTASKLLEVANQRGIPLHIVYINCKLKRVADTEYRLMAQLCREFGKEVPPTGLPTDEIYKIFYKVIDEDEKIIILMLDEIDQLAEKTGNGLLYNLTRMNSELKNAKISIVGISNSLFFTQALDQRVKSSLSEEEIVFPPYDAVQLKEILTQRAGEAFKKGVVESGVIEKCAAFAAREHGDARRALELLRVAGELAERECAKTLVEAHIDQAQLKIDRDKTLESVETQPKQHQAVLYSIVKTCQKRNDQIFTGEIYELYQLVCNQAGLRPLTQRRVSDIIAEFDMLGLINAKVVSKGRYGRTREISLLLPEKLKQKATKILEDGLGLM